jgi:hypothetical protein
MTNTPIQIAERAPSRLIHVQSELSRRANLRLKLERIETRRNEAAIALKNLGVISRPGCNELLSHLV